MSKICYDHLGNKFSSIGEMCNYYNINKNTYEGRMNRGWSQKNALTISTGQKDHLGNKFSSIKEMCNYYNIKECTYEGRINRGWSIEKALTTPTGQKDHLGNEFSSIKEMCNYYNINICTYIYRIRKGWSVEKALTTKLNESKEYYVIDHSDHLGNVFNTQKEMCDAWNILMTTYRSRIKRGWSQEKALTTPLNQPKKQITDHLGNEFSSKTKMLDFYNIDINVYNARLKQGWTQKKALTTPIKKIKINNIKGTYKYTYNNKHYYLCSNSTWKEKKILTLEQINNYS